MYPRTTNDLLHDASRFQQDISPVLAWCPCSGVVLHKFKKFKWSINCFTCSNTIYITYFKVYNNLKLQKKYNYQYITWYSLVRLFYRYDLKCYPILCLNLKIKLKFGRIHLLYIHLILRLVKRPVLVLTSLNWFFGSFLKFKISRRLRPQPSLASVFLLVFDTGHWNTICTSTHSSSYISFLYHSCIVIESRV